MTAREMKDSGIEDVGLLPLSWTVVPFWKYFSFSRGLQITKANLVDDGVPCISYGGIHSRYTRFVNPMSDELPFVPLDYLESNKKCLLNKGDFVFADTSEDIEGSGNFSCVREQALLFAGYHTIVCRLNHVGINSNFLAYLFDSYPFRKQIQKKVNGIKVFSITQAILKSTKFWLPSLEEQSRIANFLDTQCSEIDSLTADIEKQIETLQEYKKSVITEAVTKGLDPNVEMKDSGVEWLGMIPIDWVISKVKHIAEFSPSIKKICFGDVGYAPMECVKNGFMTPLVANIEDLPKSLQ